MLFKGFAPSLTLVGSQWMSEPSTGWPTVMVTGMAKGGWKPCRKKGGFLEDDLLSYWVSVTFQGVCQTLGRCHCKHEGVGRWMKFPLGGWWPNFSWVNSLLVSGSGTRCKKISKDIWANTSWCEFGHFGVFFSGMFLWCPVIHPFSVGCRRKNTVLWD